MHDNMTDSSDMWSWSCHIKETVENQPTKVNWGQVCLEQVFPFTSGLISSCGVPCVAFSQLHSNCWLSHLLFSSSFVDDQRKRWESRDDIRLFFDLPPDWRILRIALVIFPQVHREVIVKRRDIGFMYGVKVEIRRVLHRNMLKKCIDKWRSKCDSGTFGSYVPVHSLVASKNYEFDSRVYI